MPLKMVSILLNHEVVYHLEFESQQVKEMPYCFLSLLNQIDSVIP
jgi:hypothetical protein